MSTYLDHISYAPPKPTLAKLIFNSLAGILVCFLFIFEFRRRVPHCYPLTLDTLLSIILTEISRRKSERSLQKLQHHLGEQSLDAEKGEKQTNKAGVPYIVSVVGYREDSALFKRALASYSTCTGAITLLVGIDGNEADEDAEMVRCVLAVYPQAKVITLPEPLGKAAQRLAETRALGHDLSGVESDDERLEMFHDLPQETKEEAEKWAMDQVAVMAADILHANDAFQETDGFQVICVTQPHVCKKDIIFTNTVFTSALGAEHGVGYVWSSDSDTFVLEETVDQTIGCMALDPGVGGSCTSLGAHNGDASLIAAVTAAAYWSELAFCRGQTGAVEATDCQPGPCAAFKIRAVEQVLFKWYMQTAMGHKTVVNDDRHLSTLLMMNNWRITFNTMVLTVTETPSKLINLMLQQLRWSRATYVETLQYPAVYAVRGPISLLCGLRRVYGPIATAAIVLRFVWDGSAPYPLSLTDIFARLALCAGYNAVFFGQYQSTVRHWSLLFVSQVFYQIPLPGIAVWSCMTMLQNGWGTQMRSTQQRMRAPHPGWDNVGTVLAMSAWMGLVAAAVARVVISRVSPEVVVLSTWSAFVFASVWVAWCLLRTKSF
ncbi:Hyaluronan synthase 1 [Lasiodiplodia hormozganensis]|uniref:Hyaluronan synthase 1 n=1 Tax=Lasiodiplodia hormozganensis TaxID=869390 RepID=A0AA40CQ57_9PEZI|nr:Hyaluronan synthase 1 [Lasiodiplodia hormozganensis]